MGRCFLACAQNECSSFPRSPRDQPPRLQCPTTNRQELHIGFLLYSPASPPSAYRECLEHLGVVHLVLEGSIYIPDRSPSLSSCAVEACGM